MADPRVTLNPGDTQLLRLGNIANARASDEAVSRGYGDLRYSNLYQAGVDYAPETLIGAVDDDGFLQFMRITAAITNSPMPGTADFNDLISNGILVPLTSLDVNVIPPVPRNPDNMDLTLAVEGNRWFRSDISGTGSDRTFDIYLTTGSVPSVNIMNFATNANVITFSGGGGGAVSNDALSGNMGEGAEDVAPSQRAVNNIISSINASGNSVTIFYADDAVGTNASTTRGATQNFIAFVTTPAGTTATAPTSGYVDFVGDDGESVTIFYADSEEGANASTTRGMNQNFIIFVVHTAGTTPTAPTAGYVNFVGNQGPQGAAGQFRLELYQRTVDTANPGDNPPTGLIFANGEGVYDGSGLTSDDASYNDAMGNSTLTSGTDPTSTWTATFPGFVAGSSTYIILSDYDPATERQGPWSDVNIAAAQGPTGPRGPAGTGQVLTFPNNNIDQTINSGDFVIVDSRAYWYSGSNNNQTITASRFVPRGSTPPVTARGFIPIDALGHVLGNWVSTERYHPGNWVYRNGVLYEALRDTTNDDPETSATDWMPIIRGVVAGSFTTGQQVVATTATAGTVSLNLSTDVNRQIASSQGGHQEYLQSLVHDTFTYTDTDSNPTVPAGAEGTNNVLINSPFIGDQGHLIFDATGPDNTPQIGQIYATRPQGITNGLGFIQVIDRYSILGLQNVVCRFLNINGVDSAAVYAADNNAFLAQGIWLGTVNHNAGYVHVDGDGNVTGMNPFVEWQTNTNYDAGTLIYTGVANVRAADQNKWYRVVANVRTTDTGNTPAQLYSATFDLTVGGYWDAHVEPMFTEVVANPTGTDGTDLTRVRINGANFNLAGSTGGGLIAEGFTNMPLNRADLTAGDYTVVINYAGATAAAGTIATTSFSVDGVTPDSVTPTNIVTGINEYTITLSAANINNILLNPGTLNDVTFDPPGTPVPIEVTVQGNSGPAPVHEQNLITGTSSLPSRATDRLGEGSRYTLNVFNRTESTLVFRNDGVPTNVNTNVEIDVGTTVRVTVTAANISLAASAGATVVDITAGNTGNLTFTLTEEQVNMLQEVAAPLVANNQYTAGQTFRYNNASFRVLAGQTFTYTGNVQDRDTTATALTNGISNGMLETFVQDPAGHTDNLYVTFGGVRYPIVHTDEDDIAELQSEITANENAIVGVGERIDSLTNRVDSLFYANAIEHYDESAQGLVSSAFRVTTGTPYDGHSLAYLRTEGNIAFNNNGAYQPFPGSSVGGGVTLAAGSRLVNSLGDTTEHGNLNSSILLDGPNNHRNSGLATVSWMNGAGNPLFNHLYERRFQEAGTLMWFPFDLTGFGDRTFVNPIVPINGVDHVVGVDTDAIQIPGGLNVYDPATNQLVPGISRASVTGSGVTTQINFQDADGNSATLPGGQLYFITYLPDYSLGPNNNYVNKDSEYENLLIVMNHIHDTQTFPTMREAWRQALLSGWQVRYPTSFPVFMGGVTSILVQLALPGQRFNVNGLGAHNGFDFALTNTSTNPDIEGTIGPNGQIRIWDSPANLDRIERFLNSVPATNTIHCHFTNRNTDGSVNDFTEASAISLFRGDDPTRPFVNGNTGTAPILGLARRQDNAIVDQALSNGNFSAIGQRDVSFIDLYLDRNLRNFPDVGTTITLIDDRAGGLLANPFNGDTTTSTHTVAGSTNFTRGAQFQYTPGVAYDAGVVIYTDAATGIPADSQNSLFRVMTSITAAANTQFTDVATVALSTTSSSGQTAQQVRDLIDAAAGNGLANPSDGQLEVQAPSDGGINVGSVGISVNPGEGIKVNNSGVEIQLYSRKTDLFLGIEGTVGTISVAGAERSYTTFTTNGTDYYFVDGVAINSAGTLFEAGDGVWTSDDPAGGTITLANTVNLIG